MAGKLILVADYDQLVGSRLQQLLSSEGYETEVCPDLLKVPGLMAYRRPDLAIVEPSLPGGWAGDYLRKICESADSLQIPLIVLTGDYEPRHRMEALRLGAADYLTKPYDREELLLKVKNLLALTSANRARESPTANDPLDPLLEMMKAGEISELVPEVNALSRYGYSVPRAAEVLHSEKVGEELDVLDELASEGRLEREFLDIVHLCPACGHYNLNFREVCPTCESANIREQKLFKHVLCGYVGARSEFAAHHWKCPKCGRQVEVEELRPHGVRFSCRQCHNLFREPIVVCRCLHCGRFYDADSLEKRVIWKYLAVSAADEQRKAPRGLRRLRSELAPLLASELTESLLTESEMVAALERELVRRSESQQPLTILQIRAEGIARLVQKVGETRARKLLSGLLQRLLGMLPSDAVIGLYDGPSLLAILPGLSLEAARALASRLLARLKSSLPQLPVSMRLAGFPQDGRSADELLEILEAGIETLAVPAESP